MFFAEDYLLITRDVIRQNKRGKLDYDLVIIEECISMKDIRSFDALRQKNPKVNFIFTTQCALTYEDNPDFHFILANYKPC